MVIIREPESEAFQKWEVASIWAIYRETNLANLEGT